MEVIVIMYNLDELNEFFKNDIFATKLLNAKILEANNDYAKCFFEITADHKNAKGVVMGGAIFSLADFTFAVATNHDKPGIVSLSSTITFNAIAKGEKIICEAKKIKLGRTTCVYEMTLTDENDNLLATVLTTGYNTCKN